MEEVREKIRVPPDRKDMYPEKMEMEKTAKSGLLPDTYEYKSFDMLWNDLETRVKQIVVDLQEPIINEQQENTLRCKKMKKIHA